ncbi:hypothetical protein CHLRE_11g467646v5 [Chlamydomonas reinhardtii]|uniref:Uncharacterized protein n=1 Tax=Chlamydomonas reinhardtii TaxID=3055 RepID=A0A2K3D7J8_CHLRE|nr:uncharacterized protein CHLRE_11g467646v5 [Chlamydomonas reinhardtii]PNW76504.1 hypothetical protein CHLRE_11g467646v5 [Chlamydomonas reinhardtii]
MWEVTKYNPAKLFDEVPDEAFHAYQYFNIPANLEPGNKKNPLEILRKIAHPDDFVLVKLDIDNSSLENAYIAQLLADPALLSLVDEMFFEHHVNFEPLWRNWGSSADKNLFLADSYKLFFSFRQKGVRFHGWP